MPLMKTASERPNVWHVIVAMIALLYWGYFGWSLLFNLWLACQPGYQDAYPRFSAATYFILSAVVFLPVGIYLIRDLIRQVSLFFQRRTE
jgi:hypothetical protein